MSRSGSWFVLDNEWLEENFRKHEPDLSRKLHQNKFRGDDTVFGVPIGNVKITRKLQFHPAAQVIKYHQNSSNHCSLGSLASSFHCINDNRAVPDLVNSIEE